MGIKEGLKHGRLFANIPRRLEIEGRPELNIFSLNVLFTQFGFKDGRRVMGSALYEPDLDSYITKGNRSVLFYHNAFGGSGLLYIEYDTAYKKYRGEKFLNGLSTGSAEGGDNWNMFFVHFTALGLTNSEKCEFTYLD